MSRGGRIAFGCLCVAGLTGGSLLFLGSDRAPILPPVTRPPPHVSPALELKGALDLPNGYVLYTVTVDAYPIPYQCVVLGTPQQGSMHCDLDSMPPTRSAKIGSTP